VKIVGSDESIETMRAIKSGKEFGSVAQQPFEFGYRSIKVLAALHRGKQPDLPKDKIIYVDTYVIATHNLIEVEDQIREKLSLLEKYKAFGG
jgi:ribose transport system substrate-binding protein